MNTCSSVKVFAAPHFVYITCTSHYSLLRFVHGTSWSDTMKFQLFRICVLRNTLDGTHSQTLHTAAMKSWLFAPHIKSTGHLHRHNNAMSLQKSTVRILCIRLDFNVPQRNASCQLVFRCSGLCCTLTQVCSPLRYTFGTYRLCTSSSGTPWQIIQQTGDIWCNKFEKWRYHAAANSAIQLLYLTAAVSI